MKLYQLSNGDWVDPLTVTAIRKLAGSVCDITETVYEPRYCVHLDDGAMILVECADMEQVNKQVNELATAVNNAV